MASQDTERIELSIVIKTLNEAANIERTIRFARAAAAGVSCEIIVADSLSSDATVELAAAAGARTTQLLHARDRSCGVGAQLGFQESRGRYVYLLDGDMECVPGFIDQALRYLQQHPDVAGVAGDMVELTGGSYEFQLRKTKLAELAQGGWHGEALCLDGGGIFKRAALEQIGYVTDRNLHAYEEKDLGFRLIAAGWRLVRLPVTAVRHKGHVESTWPLLRKRWRTKYVNGSGDLLRASIGKPYFWRAVMAVKQYLVLAALLMFTLLSLAIAPWSLWPVSLAGLAWLLLWLTLSLRKRGPLVGLRSLLYLSFWSAGLLRGLGSTRVDPAAAIPSRSSPR